MSTPTPDPLPTLILGYAHAKAEAEAAERVAQEASQELQELLAVRRQKSSSITEDGIQYQATLVRGERLVIHEDTLRKRIGAKLWAKVTVRKLDKHKLEGLVVAGEVSPMDVAACSETVDNAPYIKLTTKEVKQ